MTILITPKMTVNTISFDDLVLQIDHVNLSRRIFILSYVCRYLIYIYMNVGEYIHHDNHEHCKYLCTMRRRSVSFFFFFLFRHEKCNDRY